MRLRRRVPPFGDAVVLDGNGLGSPQGLLLDGARIADDQLVDFHKR
jgi:hypothetical protein